jgi:hypothetical protein
LGGGGGGGGGRGGGGGGGGGGPGRELPARLRDQLPAPRLSGIPGHKQMLLESRKVNFRN